MESRFHRVNASVGRCGQGERVIEGNVSFKIVLNMLLVMECSNCLLVDSWVRKKKHLLLLELIHLIHCFKTKCSSLVFL